MIEVKLSEKATADRFSVGESTPGNDYWRRCQLTTNGGGFPACRRNHDCSKEKMEDLRVKPSGEGCIEIELSNRRIFRHNKHYNAYILDFNQASRLARRLLQVPAVGHKIAEQLTWTPYRIKPKGIINAPKGVGPYLVSVHLRFAPSPSVRTLYYNTKDNYWVDSWGGDFEGSRQGKVLAWRALPTPYNETEE